MECTYAVPIQSEGYDPKMLSDEHSLEKIDSFDLDDINVVKTGLPNFTKQPELLSHPLQNPAELKPKALERSDDDEIAQSSSSTEEYVLPDEPSSISSEAGIASSIPTRPPIAELNDRRLSRDILNHTPAHLGSEVVLHPFNYVCSLGSKGVREKFIDALNVWIKAPEECVGAVKQVSQMLHNSSLLLDDFQDSSSLRRGKPAAHTIFGAPQTVNSSSYHIILAMQEVLSSFGANCLSQTIQQLLTLFIGQSFDLHWTYNSICPSISEYISMIDNKTGALFTLLTGLLFSRTNNNNISGHHVNNLATLMGRYFQIRDDYQNLMSADYANQKGFCEDLDEGKYSLPLIHLLRKEPNNLVVRNMLSTRRIHGQLSLEQKMIILEEFKNAGSLKFTRTVLQDLHQDIGREIRSLEEALAKENRPLRLLWELLRVA